MYGPISLLWQVAGWLYRAALGPGPLYFDEALLAGLKPRTVFLYREQVQAFISYVDRWGLPIDMSF